MTTTSGGALSGITVIDLSRMLPGPYGSMILADHGARVIAVEDRRFAADGLFLTTVNRNKEHISLNLKTEAGRDIFFRLAKRADVILEGFRPGVVQRLGVDYESVRRINPGIVYCALTGYGQTGDLRDRAGHDVNYLAQAGVLDMIGTPDAPPIIPGIQLADMAGGMNAVIGILLALLVRQRSGNGQYVDISMTDTAASFLPLVQFFGQLAGHSPRRGDWMLSHRYACYNTYETADGRHLAIGAVENRFWKKLCDHLGVSEYAPWQYDETRREAILAFMRKTFREKPLAQWAAELDTLDVCWSPVQSVTEAMTDPMFRQREMVVELADAKGVPMPVLGVPVKLSDTPGSVRTPPVAFGDSTRAVLAELGFDDDQIEAFFMDGVT